MDRMLIERIEGRILVGIVMFVGIMILVGWVAINEEARMASFERTFTGRSIERGAELFAANCSTCHGADGRGQLGVAPGLNNPHLFGYNPFTEVVDEINRTQIAINTLEEERESLVAEIGLGADAERVAEIQERIPEIDMLLNPELATLDDNMRADLEGELAEADEERASQIEQLLEINDVGTLGARLEVLRAERDGLINTIEPAIINGYLPGLENLLLNPPPTDEEFDSAFRNLILNNGERLAQAGWEGTLDSYIYTTLVHGRPGTSAVWGGNLMAAWSQTAGGPLRDDEIGYLVDYITNWQQSEYTVDDLLAVNQYSKLKADAALVGSGEPENPPIGTDVASIMTAIEGLEGDPARGEAIYNGQERTQLRAQLGCAGCHAGGAQAPATEEQWSLINNERLSEPQFDVYTPEQYIAESIVLPNAYVVDGYNSGVMPQLYGDQISAQDLVDIIAYVRSYSE